MNTECQAIFHIFRDYEKFIEKLIFSKTKDHELSQDLRQKVLIKLYDNCKKVSEVSNLKSWLFRVTQNTINDHFRELYKLKEAYGNIEFGMHEEAEVEQKIQSCLVKLINKMPTTYKEPLKLADMQGKKQTEIADQLGLSLSATKARIQRGRIKLKTLFFQCCSDVLSN